MVLSDYTPVISSIKLPGSNEKYYFKDAYAREVLEGLSQYSKFLGVTTTELTDGASTNPIIISGESVTATTGCIVIYQSKEFIFGSDSKWAEFGDLSALINQLGDLAYEDTASTTYTPEGSVSVVLSANEQTVSFNFTGYVTDSGYARWESLEWEDVASADSSAIRGENVCWLDVSGTTISASASQTAPIIWGKPGVGPAPSDQNYAPSGDIIGEFSGYSSTISVSGTTTGSVTVTFSESLTPDYTPSGTISAPSITVTPSTSNFYQVTSVGTLPSLSGGLLTMSMGTGVDDETLIFSVPDVSSMFNAGTLPSLASESTAFVTGISDVDYASDFTFTGTGVAITPKFSGSTITCSGSFTPEGELINMEFIGESVYFEASVDIDIPATTISGRAWNNSPDTMQLYLQLDPDPNDIKVSASFTPNVTVSSATFTGSSATITVSASE